MVQALRCQMAKTSCLIVAAVLLCSTILLFSHRSMHSLRGDPPHPHASSSPTYKRYIVMLKAPPGVDTMDDDTRLSWYRSFLPNNLTDSGEPRLIHAFKIVFPAGFTTWLTEAELDAMSKKSGFVKWIPDRIFYNTHGPDLTF